MPKENQPLAEVFGHLPTDFSSKAMRYRRNKLCPFNNQIPNCTKDKARDPLGVCSIHYGEGAVITGSAVSTMEKVQLSLVLSDFEKIGLSLTMQRISSFLKEPHGLH